MENLIKKASRGDADAFTDLMMSQMQGMYKTARAILSNEEDAADAISETILTCWEKLDTLQKPQYFRTWMTRILINKCRDILGERSRFVTGDELPQEAEPDAGFANMEWNEALLAIDERYRLILILYYVEGYKSSEISEILNLPHSTVRTRIQRGREYLAQLYAGEFHGKKVTDEGSAKTGSKGKVLSAKGRQTEANPEAGKSREAEGITAYENEAESVEKSLRRKQRPKAGMRLFDGNEKRTGRSDKEVRCI